MKLASDRAARYYDQPRAEQDWVMPAVADGFLRVMRATSASENLKVGIGTGRIATTLFARDLNLVGVDLSLAMMRRAATLYRRNH